MGNNEANPPAKESKPSAAQEQSSATSISPATPIYPDWSIYQAYSPIPPTGFFHSAVASSPPPYPYVWGAQHLFSPFGTPPPYVMHPHGGIYAHPLMAPGSHLFNPYATVSPTGNGETPGAVPASKEVEIKPSEGKEKSSIKRSEGSLRSLKNSEVGKTLGASGNEAYTQSGDSGSEASSEGSDADSQNGSPSKEGDHQNSSDAGTHNNENPASTDTGHGSQNRITHPPSQPVPGHDSFILPVRGPSLLGAVTGPTSNLNIGTEFWSATNPPPNLLIRGKVPSIAVPTTLVPGAPSELLMQDERVLKRQRRKLSNRALAQRSRLRKLAESEELANLVEVLDGEIASLKAELKQIKKDYEQLLTQNTSLKESIVEITKGTEEPILDKNEKSSAEDDNQQNLDSDRKAEGD